MSTLPRIARPVSANDGSSLAEAQKWVDACKREVTTCEKQLNRAQSDLAEAKEELKEAEGDLANLKRYAG